MKIYFIKFNYLSNSLSNIQGIEQFNNLPDATKRFQEIKAKWLPNNLNNIEIYLVKLDKENNITSKIEDLI
jgi:DNA-binding TFAR19-related protein (PDSD5 family)